MNHILKWEGMKTSYKVTILFFNVTVVLSKIVLSKMTNKKSKKKKNIQLERAPIH